MRLMKDDRVLDWTVGDSEIVRGVNVGIGSEVREVKVTVDDSDKEFSFAASTSEDDTLTSMMQNMMRLHRTKKSSGHLHRRVQIKI